eukprot:scaffold2362_cov109-Cylindrotheca_fusiformis.AAC.10
MANNNNNSNADAINNNNSIVVNQQQQQKHQQQIDQKEMIQSLIGKPKSHWIGNQQWIPAEGSRLYTTDELKDIFLQECTLFVGDSLQRRAADTLHLMLLNDNNHISDVKEEIFSSEYFIQTKHDRGFQRRTIPGGENNNKSKRRKGCIDTDWRPLLSDVNAFANDYYSQNQTELYKDYTTIVIGATIWDVVGNSRRRTSAQEIRHLIHDTISTLAVSISSSNVRPRIIWKSSGWCLDCDWTPDETKMNRGDNYKVYAANDQAQRSIQALNNKNTSSSSFVYYLDWAREVLPRSLGTDRIRSWDRNPYHYGLLPRLQFLQMLAAELQNDNSNKNNDASMRSSPTAATTTTITTTTLLCDNNNNNNSAATDLIQLIIQARRLQSSICLLLVGICIILPMMRRMKKRKRFKKKSQTSSDEMEMKIKILV